jgi:hypothetical protein
VKWLKKFILKIYFGRMAKKIAQFSQMPLQGQREVFKSLMAKVSQTEFGVQYELTPETTYDEFKSKVPIHDYEKLRPYVEKIRAGEKDILWPGLPLYLATTSGTTSGEKFIPVTKDSLDRGMASSVLCSATYLQETNNYDPLFRKMVILSANPKLIHENHLSIGKITGIFNNHIPSFMKKNRIPSVATNSIEDWDLKMLKTVEESIGQDVGMVGGFPGWIIRYFERLLEKTGAKTISEVFPNLQIITHGGVAYGPYRKRMETLIGKPFHHLEVFSASEGFMAFQDQQERDDLLLVPNGEIFYEFVPMTEWGKENPNRLSLGDVKVGENYALIISTMGGLWAYDIGDTVTFTSTKPYRLKVSGRTKHFISNSGEHLISEQVELALTHTAQSFNVEIKDFSVAPLITDEERGNRHEWLIEFEETPNDLESFAQNLSRELCKISDNYNLLIEGSVLHHPVITPLKKNAFVEYMKSINKMTHQNKVPRLMNNRSLADGIRPWTRSSL